jgi:hypothetical protein
MTQRYQKSEWNENEPTARTRRLARKYCHDMTQKKINSLGMWPEDRFDLAEIQRVLHRVYNRMVPQNRVRSAEAVDSEHKGKTEFMVFAYGVMRYHGHCDSFKNLAPEYYDAVGFALMEKLVELRKERKPSSAVVYQEAMS